MAQLIIGRRDTDPRRDDHVAVDFLGWEYPDSPHESDRNWVKTPIFARVGGLTASAEAATLTTRDLLAFRDELRACHDAGHGVARWASMEPWLDLTFTVTDGAATLEGEIRVSMGTRNCLKIVDFPQLERTDLTLMVDSLDACVREFPVVP